MATAPRPPRPTARTALAATATTTGTKDAGKENSVTGHKRALERDAAPAAPHGHKRRVPLGDVTAAHQAAADGALTLLSTGSRSSSSSASTATDDSDDFADARSSPAAGAWLDDDADLDDAGADADADVALGGLGSDPAHCREYVARIMAYGRALEAKRMPRANYMSRQHDINVTMRAMLVDWLVDVMEEFNLQQETLFLTVSIVDRFLSLMRVTRGRLQLVGIASMLIASKMEEVQAPRVEDFVFICDHTYPAPDLLLMEHQVVKALGFHFAIASPLFFAQRFLKFVAADEQTTLLTLFLIELSLLEYRLLSFAPSAVAAAAVTLALHTLHKQHWSERTSELFGYTENELAAECLPLLFTLFEASSTNPMKAIHDKYARPQFMSVALLSPRGAVDSVLA